MANDFNLFRCQNLLSSVISMYNILLLLFVSLFIVHNCAAVCCIVHKSFGIIKVSNELDLVRNMMCYRLITSSGTYWAKIWKEKKYVELTLRRNCNSFIDCSLNEHQLIINFNVDSLTIRWNQMLMHLTLNFNGFFLHQFFIETHVNNKYYQFGN